MNLIGFGFRLKTTQIFLNCEHKMNNFKNNPLTFT